MEIGKNIIYLGIGLIVIGLIITMKDKIPGIKYIGNLPGDIRYQKDGVTIYFPLITSLILSLLFSLLYLIIKR